MNDTDMERYMLKNFFLLGLLSWVSFTYAKPIIARETIKEAQSFKVSVPSEEIQARRAVAGGKIKKNKNSESKSQTPVEDEANTEVRYWEYSEE